MTSEIIPMTSSDQLKRMGLPPIVQLHATLLCNNLRLSATAHELALEAAQANGVIAGLHIGKVISEQQHDQLHALFRAYAQRTQAQQTLFEKQQPAAATQEVLEGYIQDLLADTIRDLERQISPEYRGEFYGECRGLLKALRLGEMLDEARREQWSADIYRASLQAAEQCAAAGHPADQVAVTRQRFQLDRLARLGIKPRAELPR
ncbi:hypothetical protein [Pseudomonas viridiflava]